MKFLDNSKLYASKGVFNFSMNEFKTIPSAPPISAIFNVSKLFTAFNLLYNICKFFPFHFNISILKGSVLVASAQFS